MLSNLNNNKKKKNRRIVWNANIIAQVLQVHTTIKYEESNDIELQLGRQSEDILKSEDVILEVVYRAD